MKYNNIYKINTENKRKEKNKILIILISLLTIILL